MVDLHDRIAEAFADADGVGEDNYKAFSRRFAELLSSTKARDKDLWNRLGAPVDVTIQLMIIVPVQRRLVDDTWNQGATEIIAAARRQAFLEVLMPALLDVRDRYTKLTISAAKQMSRSELRAEAKVPNATFKAASERRRANGQGNS